VPGKKTFLFDPLTKKQKSGIPDWASEAFSPIFSHFGRKKWLSALMG
jgi:hypothetical protein